MSQNKNLILKIALLSTCLVSAALNAVTGLVPEMAAAFPRVSLSAIELIATVPSLFQMVGVLGEQVLAKKLGHKGAMVLGLLFCAVGGVVPVFLPLFPVILVTRCFFGTGCGLLMSSLLTLVVAFFDGRTRSTMIGLNGGISGVGSALATFAAGQLLTFGWNMSFAVYFLGFAVLALVMVFVPKVKAAAPAGSAEKKTGRLPLGLWGLGALMFVSVMLATMYVIKASTLITEYGYGTAKEGSLAITILSLGSFAAGLPYGTLRVKLKSHTLTLAFTVCAAGFLLGGFADSLAMVWAGAFLLGYGYLIFMPYLQDQASRSYGAYGESATNLVLVFQSVGAFVTPWLGNLFGLVSGDLKVQFFITAACFILLAAASVLLAAGSVKLKRTISITLSLAILLTGSACAAAEEPPEESAASLTVSSALEESGPVESRTMALSESGAFGDVAPGDWFYEAVEYCREHGLMSGKAASRFAPRDDMTRAELAAVLYRHAKSPSVTSSPDFTDVKAGAWYTKAVAWAQENKIISGYGNGRFGTNDNVRREDIAAIFWRCAGSPETGKDAEFADMSQVSGYALEAVDWAHDPDSVEWDGGGYWWEPSHFDEPAIQRMVDESIARLGGKSTAKEGWQALFAYRSQEGYRAGEKIAIKANINGSAVMDDDTSGETAMSYTNPVLLRALLASLVRDAGVSPEDITVYDVSRLFPDYMVEMCTQGDLHGVNFVGRNNGVADENAPILWSREFSGRVNYLPTCVTEAEYVINLANLKGHSYGITLCGKNHFGSFINGNAMRPPEGANLHQWLTRNEMGIYSPIVDLMANADLGGKTVLYMLDALICAPSEGASITKENAVWQQEPFDGGFTASVFVSQDPVAIDSVGVDFLSSEPTVAQYNRAAASVNNENYLHEAGLVGNAPSGTVYTDSGGHTVTNLGVHEHWNNSAEKKYSRNLGKDGGIELIQVLK